MSKGKSPINFPTDTYKSFYLVGQFGLQAEQQVVPPKIWRHFNSIFSVVFGAQCRWMLACAQSSDMKLIQIWKLYASAGELGRLAIWGSGDPYHAMLYAMSAMPVNVKWLYLSANLTTRPGQRNSNGNRSSGSDKIGSQCWYLTWVIN